MDLTGEICSRTATNHFGIDLAGTQERCRALLAGGMYGAIIGEVQGDAVAVSTFTESYALYAGGKVGIIPEFYVAPAWRSAGVGRQLIAKVREHGRARGWSCLELCTPPLPEFERTLAFYQGNGLAPVGGRKMRQNIERPSGE